MSKPLKPLVRGSGYYPSDKGIPLVYPGGFTTSDEKNKADERSKERSTGNREDEDAPESEA